MLGATLLTGRRYNKSATVNPMYVLDEVTIRQGPPILNQLSC
jgi:hypothetical protein